MAKNNDTAASKKDAAVIKVKFLVSPTKRFNLAYSAGDEAEFDKNQATEMIELGYAEEVK